MWHSNEPVISMITVICHWLSDNIVIVNGMGTDRCVIAVAVLLYVARSSSLVEMST